ncbi:MAG: PAS domain-containing protein [Candidatus Eisenbacteria bacterium]|nr:PAS domain-containing protein [Candidatus Eisenbacteria bacterium]
MDDKLQLLEYLMDSLRDPFVFVDTKHVIRYMNKTAFERYKGKPAEIGRSIFDCHNENSNKIILDVFEHLKNGEDERMIVDDNEHRVFTRAVRDTKGNLLGYYERYEPPKKSA